MTSSWERARLEKMTPGYHVYGPRFGFSSLDQSSRQVHTGGLPRVDAVVRRAIERVLEIELVRGESETIASPIAQVLRYSGGRDVLVRILCAIGRDPKLQRTYTSGAASQGKLAVFSHLIRVTMPGKGDSLAAFAADVKAEKISENVLLAVAFYASVGPACSGGDRLADVRGGGLVVPCSYEGHSVASGNACPRELECRDPQADTA